ncbi:thiol reductant ABC exporter subunit CydD [Arthrobacter bussei]|uniref:Thiol reductant ABC exporter subunit CydD n=1 Tax=Arthrobacter bussei TaxID=2594179 RepID=A0A7X1NQK2_9MICC|nr:thiol reductant ABC exporter subunit CydD [Arthrobacter bussei]MPY11089.1 thiol reductant ABC exporter subunit CydD [Arthrobacter bussei]
MRDSTPTADVPAGDLSEATAASAPAPRRSPVASLRAGGPAGAAGSTTAVYLLGVLAAARALGLVLMAQALSVGIASVAAGDLEVEAVLVQGVAGAILRTVAAWGQDATAARLALGVRERLREAALLRVLGDGGTTRAGNGGTGQGSLAVLLTRGLDGLDAYYTQYLPSLITCTVVPLLVGARILAADWVSALIIVLTVPLVPVFMVLIGLHTQERTQQAATALGRLSDHLLELARGLPVLVGLGRAGEQTRALREIAAEYSSRTMTTLRTVFLSSLALELISTISVAVVAVFAGVRLIHGDLGLETALIALILAPECYGPLRDVGAAHHASEDGEESGARVRAVIDAQPTTAGAGTVRSAVADPVTARLAGVTVRYDGVVPPVVANVSFRLERGTVTALRGPSGTGKSTLMRALAGGAAVPAGLHVEGTITAPADGAVAWVPQHPELIAPTVRAELALYGRTEEDDPAITEVLAGVGAADLVDRRTGELSPGELRRVAVARALLRAQDPAVGLLLLDEPTAHVDEGSSAAIRAAIAMRRPGLTVLLIAHDDATAAIADTQVHLGAAAGARAATSASAMGVPIADAPDAPDGTAPRATAVVSSPTPSATSFGTSTGSPTSVSTDTPTGSPTAAPTGSPTGASAPAAVRASSRTTQRTAERTTGRMTGRAAGDPSADASAGVPGARPSVSGWLHSARHVLVVVKPWDRRFVAATLLGLGSAVFAVALTALSGWLIVRASEQPPILYLLTAIVGVRFFGIGRSLLRYEERLWLHRAVFHRADETRLRLWTGLLRAGQSWRTLARGSGGIERLVGDIDELRDLSARALSPFLTAVLTGAAALVTTAVLHPASLGWQMLAVGGAVVVAPVVAVLRERAAGAAAVQLRADALGRVARLLRAAPDLRVNGVHGAALLATRRTESLLARAAHRSAAAAGVSTAVVVAACSAAALGILVTAEGLPADVTAVLVLMQLALIEPFAAGTSAVRHWGPLAAVVGRLRPLLDSAPAGRDDGRPDLQDDVPASTLALEDASIGYVPGEPVVTGVDLTLVPGRWTGLTGPSGSGKSTVLGALLGFLPLDTGRLLVDGRSARPSTRRRVAWCPQESHLFTSTLRANLQLARRPGDPATQEELLEVVRAVGLAELVDGLEDGLDAQVGSGGSRLSGGQRQRVAVARALLTRSRVVLLDEPTAHLDRDGARALLTDLRRGLPHTAVLLVTHDPAEAATCDDVVVLGAAGEPAQAAAPHVRP